MRMKIKLPKMSINHKGNFILNNKTDPEFQDH